MKPGTLAATSAGSVGVSWAAPAAGSAGLIPVDLSAVSADVAVIVAIVAGLSSIISSEFGRWLGRGLVVVAKLAWRGVVFLWSKRK